MKKNNLKTMNMNSFASFSTFFWTFMNFYDREKTNCKCNKTLINPLPRPLRFGAPEPDVLTSFKKTASCCFSPPRTISFIRLLCYCTPHYLPLRCVHTPTHTLMMLQTSHTSYSFICSLHFLIQVTYRTPGCTNWGSDFILHLFQNQHFSAPMDE